MQGSGLGGPAPRERRKHGETGPWLLVALTSNSRGRGQQEVGAAGTLGERRSGSDYRGPREQGHPGGPLPEQETEEEEEEGQRTTVWGWGW